MNVSKKTTIIICNDFGSINGGAAKVAIQSAIGLSMRGYKVVYFCGVAPIDEDLKKHVSKIICLDQKDILNNPNRISAMINGFWNSNAYAKMDKLLEETSEDVIVHIHGWTKSLTSSIVKACKKHGVAPFISIHDYFASCPNGGFYNYKTETICKKNGIGLSCLMCNCDSRNYAYKIWRYLRQIIQDKYIRNSKSIIYIATSKFSYSAIKDSLKSKKVFWVKNPINIYNGNKVDCIKNHKFLFVGRLSKEKGVDLFCEAIKRINGEGIVIGGGDEIEKYAKEYPEVKFVGWQDRNEMEQYIFQSRALVVSSRYYEGSPLIVPEMQCYGLPCIVPDQCAAKECVTNGRNGYIFSSGDVESLSVCMKKVLNADESSTLFCPDEWQNHSVDMDEHLNQLLRAYDNSRK